jgi:CRP-like cAMP-binding protein
MKDYIIKTLLEYRNIHEEERHIIANAFTLKRYKSGQWLIKAGQVANRLFYINSGVLKITIPHPAERDIVYYFMEERQFMTFLYSLGGNVPTQQGLQAATDAEILEINTDNLNILYERLPYLKATIDEMAQLSMAQMVTMKNNFLVGDALQKYSFFLHKQPKIAQQVALVDVASYLGITPQSLSRVRRKIVTNK